MHIASDGRTFDAIWTSLFGRNITQKEAIGRKKLSKSPTFRVFVGDKTMKAIVVDQMTDFSPDELGDVSEDTSTHIKIEGLKSLEGLDP